VFEHMSITVWTHATALPRDEATRIRLRPGGIPAILWLALPIFWPSIQWQSACFDDIAGRNGSVSQEGVVGIDDSNRTEFLEFLKGTLYSA